MANIITIYDKNNEPLFPNTSSEAVYDPETKETLKEQVNKMVEDAPADGKQYARQDNVWVEVEAGAVSETVFITLLPNENDLKGASVKVESTDGDVLLDTSWQGAQLSVQIKAGIQYVVSVGDVDGYVKPESQTYTALKGASRSISFTYVESRLSLGVLSNQSNDDEIVAVKATVKYGENSIEAGNGAVISLPLDVDVTITFPVVDGYQKPDTISFRHTGGHVTKEGTYRCSVVTVVLADNQSSYDDIASATAIVTGAVSGTLLNGGNIKVPWGGTIVVSGSAVEDYKTPSISYTASDVLKTITLTYETEVVSVVLSANNGASLDGQVVTINGKNHTWSGTTIIQKVAFGTSYTVSVSDKDGYIAPESQSYSAAKSSRDLAMVYREQLLGVFVQMINGQLIDYDTWMDSTSRDYDNVNGIAVLSYKCQFVINIRTANTNVNWGDGTTVQGIVTTTNLSEAQLDFDGEGNTKKIVEQIDSDYCCAKKCQEYTFPNGEKGYLGSVGEWNAILNNIDYIIGIQSTFENEIGINKGSFMTSTQYDSGHVWLFKGDDGSFYSAQNNVSTGFYIFSKINY